MNVIKPPQTIFIPEGNKVIMVCKHDCHPAIHKFISEKELGRKYNTIELLLTSQQPPTLKDSGL